MGLKVWTRDAVWYWDNRYQVLSFTVVVPPSSRRNTWNAAIFPLPWRYSHTPMQTHRHDAQTHIPTALLSSPALTVLYIVTNPSPCWWLLLSPSGVKWKCNIWIHLQCSSLTEFTLDGVFPLGWSYCTVLSCLHNILPLKCIATGKLRKWSIFGEKLLASDLT